MNYSEIFEKNRYCVVRNAISQQLVSFFTQYAFFDEIRSSCRNEETSDYMVPGAYSKYGDPAMESLMVMLHPEMEKITGLQLHPTYSYYRIYRNGDELKRHKDRESCEISTTLSFNFSYDSSEFDWPIFIDGKGVSLNPGDMVVYRGLELEHWRDPLVHTDDVWHVQTFLHYVDANGPNASWKHDRRESLGRV